ncbi:MAG: hypothetical protein K2G80_01000, partial [Bacteroidales bacterium]|nr:hypothetical protein [Bacteroidales bacterium]
LKTLSGTVWEKSSSGVVTTLSFTKVQCELRFASISYPQESETSYYSYEYDSSIVMMYPEDDNKAAIRGIISGNTMSVVNMSNNKTIGIFTKK